MAATISGRIIRSDGSPESESWIRFSSIEVPSVSSGSLAINRPLDVQLDANGEFTTDIVTGTYWVAVAGVHPWMILIAEDSASYRLEQVVIWPVQASAGTTVWLKNADDGKYYRLTSSGTGSALGLIVDPNGSAAPTGFLATSIWMKSDDGSYYQVTISGTGDSLGVGVNTSGSSSPSGAKYDSLTVPSLDGNWTNRVTCVGSGAKVGLTIT